MGIRSFMCIRKKSGSKTEPWGTSAIIFLVIEE